MELATAPPPQRTAGGGAERGEWRARSTTRHGDRSLHSRGRALLRRWPSRRQSWDSTVASAVGLVLAVDAPVLHMVEQPVDVLVRVDELLKKQEEEEEEERRLLWTPMNQLHSPPGRRRSWNTSPSGKGRRGGRGKFRKTSSFLSSRCTVPRQGWCMRKALEVLPHLRHPQGHEGLPRRLPVRRGRQRLQPEPVAVREVQNNPT